MKVGFILFNFTRQIILETYFSSYNLKNFYFNIMKKLYFYIYFFKQLIPVEYHYKIYNKKLLAIIKYIKAQNTKLYFMIKI